MKIRRRLYTMIAIAAALMAAAVLPAAVYGAENEAYVYKYSRSDGYANNYVEYADGNGSAYAYLSYLTGPDGSTQQYGGYCVDFESTVVTGSYYSRTTLGESDHFSTSVSGHLRAILANSVPVQSLSSLAAASGVSGLDYGEAVAATQWAIWAYTNPSSPEISIPDADGASDQEKAAYYLYNLDPISSGYATEPVRMEFDVYQDGSRMIFDYSGSVNVDALQDKIITVKDGAGDSLPYTDENHKIIVDVSGLNSDQTVSVVIEGSQVLAADAYFYAPEGGRMASQSLISWFEGRSAVSGSAFGSYDVEKEKAEIVLNASKQLTGRDIDLSVDNFKFIVKDADTGVEAAEGTAAADGSIAFSPISYNKTQAGQTFNYVIAEAEGDNPGITYDNSVKTVAVTVGYEDGKVVPAVKYDEEAGMTFVNEYTAEDGDIVLAVEKNLVGKMKLKEGMFTFTKVECDEDGIPLEGAETETVSNGADGSVKFDKMTYSAEGVYYYLIRENNGGRKIGGIVYDDMNMIVKVNVTDNKLGQLVAEASYPDEAVFRNVWDPEDVTVVLEGTKKLTGRHMEEGEFTFQLKNAEGELIDEAVNDAKGSFAFSEMVFDAEGEYVFEVSEAAGELPGVKYDDSVFEVTVTVVDDLSGRLKAEVTYPENGLVFNNCYEGGKLKVTKVVTMEGVLMPVDLKYHAALFMDPQLTQMTLHGVQTIHMNGSAESTVVFEDLEYGKTYYVAETDQNGRPIVSGDFGIKTVTIVNNAVTVSSGGDIPETLIINEYANEIQLIDDDDGNKGDDEDKDDENKEGENTGGDSSNVEQKDQKIEKDKAVKTTDTFELAGCAAVIILSAAGMAGALFFRRRES